MKSSGRSVSVEEKAVALASESSNRKDKSKSIETNDNHNKPYTALAHTCRIPIRPNQLRRPLLQPASLPVRNVGQPLQQPIELAALPRAPRRPARLPAAYTSRYSTLSSGQLDPEKPNRYSWAQRGLVATSQTARSKAAVIGKSGAHFSSHLSNAASRVFVVNPMHIVNLSEHTKSRLIKIIEALKRFSEKWFSHVLLLLFLAVYACFGAYIFLTFEAPTERAEKQLIIDLRNQILNGTFSIQLSANNTNNNATTNQTTMDLSAYNKWLSEQLIEYENLLTNACASGITSSSLENQWNFWGALFYSMTVFTTIGYGQLAPITFSGRVATVAYAIFGIPILLMVLADLGKLLTRIIKFTFRKLHYLYNYLIHRKSSIRTRRLISRNTRHYKRASQAALRRWFNHITSYLQPPESVRKCLLRFARTKKPKSEIEEANSNPMTISDSRDSKESAQVLSKGTQVIVTPAKQSKPVSPQPGMHMSPTGLIAGSVTSDSRLGRHHIRHHHKNFIPNHQHDHHTQTHHMPRLHRSQSPGQGASKRKNSMARHVKGSVSRSSSSSVVMQMPGPKTDGSVECSSNKKNVDCKLESNGISASVKELPAEQEEQEEPEEEPPFVGELYEDELDELIEEDDFDIPVSFALFLLVAYMILGASLFGIWEGWDFFSSLYFVFISMSTIGFGDLVPKQQPKRMIGTFIYLLFGLALTSMCINVVQEKIHATFLRAKMQIGEKMGLDLDQIMADDYYEGSLGPDDYDCQSVTAGSQLNSCTLHPFAPTTGACDCYSDCVQHQHQEPHSSNNNNDTSKSVRLSRGSNSLRSRLQLRSGHHHQQLTPNSINNPQNGYSIPFLRKPSCKRSAYSKPAASSTQATVNIESSVSMPNTPATGKLLEEQRQPFAVEESLATVTANNKCQPLVTGRARLEGTRSQPSQGDPGKNSITQQSQSTVCRSLSSELAGSRPESTLGGAQSVSSSRRSSVSQELNQLDDIIQTLGKSASVQRFGPLLGIPVAKSRASRTSSPVEPPAYLKLASSTSANSPVHRRSTSMIHSRRKKPAQQVVLSANKETPHIRSSEENKKKASPADTTQLAIEELEAIKLSLT